MNREPRKIKIHQSLIRPQLFFGCERELAMTTILGSLTLVFALQSVIGIITGLAIAFVSLWGLREMSKRDPRMSKKYLRSLKYKTYYNARSTPFAKPSSFKK